MVSIEKPIEKPLVIKTDAATVLAGIRRALSELVSCIPGDIRRPTDLQRALGVDYKLCWQVFNVTRTDDPLSVSQHVPSTTSTKKLITAARSLAVPESVLRDVDQAMKEFQDVVATHSGDRRGFDSMVASISGGDAAESLALQHRRDAFRSESQIWGIQVETYLRQMIVRRCDDGRSVDSCFVNAKYGMSLLRRDVMPVIHGYRETSSGMTIPDLVEPLDIAASKEFGAPVLAEFSSQPVPNFKTIQHSDGWIYSALNSDQIGRMSTVNMVFGGVTRNLKIDRDENGAPSLVCGAALIAPTELAVMELLVHRPSFGDVVPQLRVFATGAGVDVPEVMRLTQQFVIHEQVMAVGPAHLVSAVSEAPSYLMQLKYVFGQLNWNPEEFDIFRVKIPYPILHTRARLLCEVPDL
jgi:hypothetical protein